MKFSQLQSKLASQNMPTKRGLILAKIVISILVLAVLIQKISIDEILAAAYSSNKWLIFCALFLLPLNLLLQFKKWQLLVRLEAPETKVKQVLFSLLAGITLGLITPGRIGEFGRFLFIRNARWPRLLGYLAVEKFYAMLALHITGLLGFSYFVYIAFEAGIQQFSMIGILILIALLVLLVFNPTVLKKLVYKVESRWSHKKRTREFFSSYQNVSNPMTRLLFLYSFLQTLVYYIQLSVLVNSFFRVSVVKGMLAAASTMLTKAFLPFAIGDLGIRETAAVFYFGKLGVPHAAAFDASVLLFMINLLIPGIVGFFLVLKFHSSASDLNQDTTK